MAFGCWTYLMVAANRGQRFLASPKQTKKPYLNDNKKVWNIGKGKIYLIKFETIF